MLVVGTRFFIKKLHYVPGYELVEFYSMYSTSRFNRFFYFQFCFEQFSAALYTVTVLSVTYTLFFVSSGNSVCTVAVFPLPALSCFLKLCSWPQNSGGLLQVLQSATKV